MVRPDQPIHIRSCTLGLVLAVTWVSMPALAQDSGLFHFAENPGGHSVGLKIVEQYDYSRTYRDSTDALGRPYGGERARPLQTLIWYPAKPTAARRMTVRDYADLLSTETSFDKPRLTTRAKEWISAMRPALGTALWAVRDAAPVAGRLPVVVYAPSFSAMSWENADLCEYLASFGYLVVASPSLGAATRDMTLDVAGVDAQARDIEFLVGYASTLTNTDRSAVAVVGFSWGGLSNFVAASRDQRIAALVALDGTLRYRPNLLAQAGVDATQSTVPLLYFAQGQWTLEDQAHFISSHESDGGNVLNALTHSDLFTVHMLGLIHQEFSSMYQRNEDMWRDFRIWQKADYTRSDGVTGYALVARYTLGFLDAYLKHDARAMAYLRKTPAENGAPEHFMAVSARPAAGVVPSIRAFRAELGRQGFRHAVDVYEAMRKVKADFRLDEQAVNAWAEELIDDNHVNEALALGSLNILMYPDSAAATGGRNRV